MYIIHVHTFTFTVLFIDSYEKYDTEVLLIINWTYIIACLKIAQF